MNLPLTLQQCKDQIAQRMGFKNWKRFETYVKPTSAIVDEVAILFASEKIKEALQVAAKDARICMDRSFPEPHKLQIASYSDGVGTRFSIDKDSILALEKELIEKLKSENNG